MKLTLLIPAFIAATMASPLTQNTTAVFEGLEKRCTRMKVDEHDGLNCEGKGPSHVGFTLGDVALKPETKSVYLATTDCPPVKMWVAYSGMTKSGDYCAGECMGWVDPDHLKGYPCVGDLAKTNWFPKEVRCLRPMAVAANGPCF